MGRCPKPHQGNDSLGTPFAYGVFYGVFFMGRYPKPHQGNDSLGTPFACGAGERNTPFTDYLSSAKAKAFANRVKGVTPLQGS